MLLYWVWFSQLKRMSALQKQQALRYFRDPEDAYKRDADSMDMPQKFKDALQDKDLTRAQRIIEDCRAQGIGIITMADRTYPPLLRSRLDAPLVLYFKGKLPGWRKQPVIGVVGTRFTSAYGDHMATMFGQQIAACGGLVVSGGAAGVDTRAMRGALDVGKPTVAVLGCGVDVVYPSENKKLFQKVQEEGCLLSEYPPGIHGNRWTFPARNRIIAGISDAVLVVEAPRISGALITARNMFELGRPVFTVPGNINLDSCAGSNALLQEGADAVFSGWDVLKDFAPSWPDVQNRQPVLKTVQFSKSAPSDKKVIDKDEKSTYSVLDSKKPALPEEEQRVLAQIGREPILLDQLIDRLGMSAGAVKMLLTKLSVKGLVTVLPGGRVSLK